MAAYSSLDEAYKAITPSLVAYANKHIFNRAYSIDAVHDAFVKAQIYLNKHPGAKVSGFLLQREVARVCRRMNKKYSPEWSADANVIENQDKAQ